MFGKVIFKSEKKKQHQESQQREESIGLGIKKQNF